MPDFKNKTWILSDFIKFVQAKNDRALQYDPGYYYSIYVPEKAHSLSSEMMVYIGDTSEIDDDDNEIYPLEVREMNFWFGYSCDNFQDVIDLAFKQNPQVSISQLIECLNYYSEHDNFLDII